MSVTFEDNSADVLNQLAKNVEKALEMIGLHWQRRATEQATKMGVVDTGRFRSSLSYITPESESGANKQRRVSKASQDGDTLTGKAPKNIVVVGTNVEYAPYLEFGSRGRPARPTIQNSVINYQKDYAKIAQQTLAEGFGGTETG